MTKSNISVDKTGLGALQYGAAILCLSAMDASAKLLTSSYPVGEVLIFRSLFGFLPLIFSWRSSIPLANTPPTIWLLQLLRGALVIGCMLTFLIAVKHISLVSVTAISLAAPLFMTIFAAVLLRETVGLVRWGAITAGFVGICLVMRDGGLSWSAYSGVALLSAIFYALIAILTKHLSRTVPATITTACSNVMLLIFCIVLFSDRWLTPSAHDLGILAIMGIAGGLSSYLLAAGTAHADVSVIAPIEYTILVWATAFGYAFFNEVPALSTLPGILIIAISGIVNIRQQR
ncbi:hypothetical protein ATN84_24845 [Paramesorhizobium deserti]|uniref:EamA domain-containing protein n=1 Tax=Paramesorhizobium deserti TaxID=1494590 RepID=A0A135HXL2_9HYPH|nr:DMT family transporter [Paramesorhizobium deserti]KXF77946.1 hypothetical protein ATN84_24845 [Paramesorhizobium deserti]